MGQTSLGRAHDVPERTGRGDAIDGVATPSNAIGSSSSSSGEIVSSDYVQVSVHRQSMNSVNYKWLFPWLARQRFAQAINRDERCCWCSMLVDRCRSIVLLRFFDSFAI